MKTLNNLILSIISVIIIIFTSQCSYNEKHCGWYLEIDGIEYVYCDSLEMLSDTSAIVYVNGTSTNIYGKEIRPAYTPCK